MNLIKNEHRRPCSVDGCESMYIFRKKDWLCQYHLKMDYLSNSKKVEKKPIRQFSKKRVTENKVYSKTRVEFLSLPENKICFIDGCFAPATTIEHTAGRIGSMYLNQKFWKPCCLKHNLELENNSELSKKYQLSKIHGGKKI